MIAAATYLYCAPFRRKMAKDPYATLKLPTKRVFIRDASFLRRIAAFLTDILLLDFAILSVFSQFFDEFTLSRVLDGGLFFSTEMYAAAVVMALLAFAYFVLFEYLLGQTPGMMLVNIRAERITLWRAVVRNLYFIPIFPFPFLALVEPFYLAFRKARFLELLSGTRTVEYLSY